MRPVIFETLLRRAAEAHHEYEKANGPDPDWAPWYAAHMAAEYNAALEEARHYTTGDHYKLVKPRRYHSDANSL